jgi:DNA-binding GntR family transcriptional regulator
MVSAGVSDSSDLIPAAPIDLPSIPDVVYRQLRRDLARGVYKPGPIRIRPLAERFGVSATPVREALRRLEAEGLVTLRKNQIVVNSLSESELREVFAIRSELETFALRKGAETIRNDHELLADLDRLVDLMDEHEHDLEEWRAANQEFHMRIYHTAGMPRLSSMIDSLWNVVITRAGPSATPCEAAIPRSSLAAPESPSSHIFTVAVVTPNSITVNGSVISRGATPSAGGGDHCRSTSMIRLRSAISAGQ